MPVLGMMARPGSEFHATQLFQLAADRRLIERDCKFFVQPLDQIGQPLPHHSVDRRNRTLFDNVGQCLPLRIVQPSTRAGRLAAELAKFITSLPQGTPIKIWFHDEARVGQKNKIAWRWAGRGSRPSTPKHQRPKSAHIFGVIYPEHGRGAGLVLPFSNTETMALDLAEISFAVAPGARAVVPMDQAG